VRLNLDQLLDAASQHTGLSDYGSQAFREALQVLLDSLAADAALNAIGEMAAPAMVHQLLVNRLELAETRKRHPEIGQEQIRRPIFILGLGRTGTTALHALLAADPAHRAPLSWEVSFPCPPPEPATYDSDPRIAQTEAQLAMLLQIIPEFQAIHPQGAREPQECVAVTAHEFMSVQLTSTFRATSYWDWLEAQKETRWAAVYEFHRRFLQHLQWKCPGERWVLKSPGHLYSLDALLDAYPDAGIIQTHRHPAEVMASTASLHAVLRSAYSDDIHPAAIGAEILERFARVIERAMSVRARRPQDAGRFIDVQYRDFLADPLACVRRIYDQLRLPYTNEARARMQHRMAASPKDKHGAHQYTLASYGLNADQVYERCRGYCQRFGFERQKTG
jgi:hypothetical protein